MASTFFGLETATRALQMNQAVLDVIGHNISNVNTPNYTRQAAEVNATDPYMSNTPGLPTISMGTGVQLTAVSRVRDAFVEAQLNKSLGDQGSAQQLSNTLAQVQTAYNEPGSAGLNSALTTFFNSFQDVANDPQNTGPRVLVQQYAGAVATKFRDLESSLTGASADITNRVQSTVNQANDLAHQIAALNIQVQQSVSVGGQANDIQDRRDGLVQQLTTLVGGTVIEEQDGTGKKTGSVDVSVGGVPLIQSGTVVELPSKFANVRGQPVLISSSGQPIPVQSGQLNGLIKANANVTGYLNDLNTLAAKFITTVNAQHKAGYGLDGQTGRPLFSGTDASNIALDSVVANDAQAIAAASAPATPGSPPVPGNGDNALAIANIANQPVFGTLTLQDYYGESITKVGADAGNADSQVTNQGKVVQQITNVRNSVSGVSMDEELTNMLSYQRSYQAAAKLVTTYDTMLQTLISAVA